MFCFQLRVIWPPLLCGLLTITHNPPARFFISIIQRITPQSRRRAGTPPSSWTLWRVYLKLFLFWKLFDIIHETAQLHQMPHHSLKFSIGILCQVSSIFSEVNRWNKCQHFETQSIRKKPVLALTPNLSLKIIPKSNAANTPVCWNKYPFHMKLWRTAFWFLNVYWNDFSLVCNDVFSTALLRDMYEFWDGLPQDDVWECNVVVWHFRCSRWWHHLRWYAGALRVRGVVNR